MHGVGFVRFRKARPSTLMLKLAARGRDSACPEYAWGFWRRVTFLLTSTMVWAWQREHLIHPVRPAPSRARAASDVRLGSDPHYRAAVFQIKLNARMR